jgi:hypothetical protein
MRVIGCRECDERVRTDVHLRGACASVGIEHGMTTDEAMTSYVRSWHERGHGRTEPASAPRTRNA